MFLRTLKKPLPLQKLEAVHKRAPANYKRRQEMEKDLAMRNKGFIGEKKVINYLKMLPSRYLIIPDVCLEFQGNQFQVDNIILSPHTIFLIDSKNFGGKITFDTLLKQLIRDDGSVEKGYRYPLTQLETHQLLLQNWFHERNFHSLPIHYFVAIAEPSTIIDVIGDRLLIADVVTHAESLPKRILTIDEKMRMEGASQINAQQIGKAILGECKEYDKDIMSQYGLKISNLLPGVLCPSCGFLKMVWTSRRWHCPKCKESFQHAHRAALTDYFLLGKPYISNSEASKFLQVECRHQVKRLLTNAGLEYNRNVRGWSKK